MKTKNIILIAKEVQISHFQKFKAEKNVGEQD